MREKLRYEESKARNTIYGYDKYLKEYPNGAFVLEVNNLRKEKEQQGREKQTVPKSLANGGLTK